MTQTYPTLINLPQLASIGANWNQPALTGINWH